MVLVTMKNQQKLMLNYGDMVWATLPLLHDDQHLVYLMYRKDMGFRIGATNSGGRKKVGKKNVASKNLFSRVYTAKAHKFWILNICCSKASSHILEASHSLEYRVPQTSFFNFRTAREQKECEEYFKKFESNGFELLNRYNLFFDVPHWQSEERKTIKLDKQVLMPITASGLFRGSKIGIRSNGIIQLEEIVAVKRVQDPKIPVASSACEVAFKALLAEKVNENEYRDRLAERQNRMRLRKSLKQQVVMQEDDGLSAGEEFDRIASLEAYEPVDQMEVPGVDQTSDFEFE